MTTLIIIIILTTCTTTRIHLVFTFLLKFVNPLEVLNTVTLVVIIKRHYRALSY